MRDLKSDIVVRPNLAQATRTSTAEGAAVDRSGFESVTFALVVGAWTSGKHEVTLTHSDDGISYDTVPAAMIVGSAVAESAGGSPEDATLSNGAALVGYVGAKRYVKPSITVEGPASAVTSLIAILGHAHHRPTR